MNHLTWREERPSTRADHATIAASYRARIAERWAHTPRHEVKR